MKVNALHPRALKERLVSAVRNSPPVRYPDLGLMCLGVFVMLIGVGAVAPIRSIYARDHGSTMAELGLMASAFLLGGLVFQMPGGWASDKWGRKPLLLVGVIFSGVISFLFLASDHPWWFIALRFIEGGAAGAVGPSANAYVIDAVPARERGSAFGWLGSAFSAGFMVGPAIGGVMVDWLGYTSPFIFGGVAPLAVAVLLIKRMKNRKPGAEPATGAESAEALPAAEVKSRKQVPQKLFVPALAGAIILTLASGFGDGLFISIWSLWLDDLHASTSFIGLTFVLFSLPLMVLMPVSGKMADRYRLAPLIMVPGVLISFVYLTYGLVDSLPVIAAMGILEGTFIAIMGPAISSYIANLSPDNARGRLQGVISTARTVAGFTSSMLTALLYENGAFYPFIMLFGVQLAVAIVGGTVVWRIERRTAEHAAQHEVAAVTTAPQAGGAPSPSPSLETAAR